jgi:hypothetical protein
VIGTARVGGVPLQGRATDVVVLRHTPDADDPLLYAHVTDTVSGQIHMLMFVVIDPQSLRFDVDRMLNGQPTKFGALRRNLAAEEEARRFGLAPGQVQRGLRLLEPSLAAFEGLVSQLGHDLYFVEPLLSHNPVLFERVGFSDHRGRGIMERIHAGFGPSGRLVRQLDGSTPFRKAAGGAHHSRS